MKRDINNIPYVMLKLKRNIITIGIAQINKIIVSLKFDVKMFKSENTITFKTKI